MPKTSAAETANNTTTTPSEEEQYPNEPRQSEAPMYNSRHSGKLGPITEDLSLGAKLRLWGNRVKVVVIILGILFLAFAVVQACFFLGNWGLDTYDTYHYGPTRTASITATLGINNDSPDNPSDVAISNIRGNIIITVIPAGDGSKTQTYPLSYRLVGDGISKTPVWVSTTKMNSGTAIMIHIKGQNTTPLLIPNGHGGFIWSTR